ncbi:MAG: M14 family metallocarboxypeptidase [Myxococcaceae bacterium]|nr:M14 family metallocarboxypeptidase [Myxococcaceae bacterium]
MTSASWPFPIGTPGTPWTDAEKQRWRASVTKRRSYADDVLPLIERLKARFEVVSYGALPYGADGDFPLFLLKSRAWNDALPLALITGGVHGYETSGVHGALRFAERDAQRFEGRLNLVIAPCVSPWAYERIQRWNPHAVDPNRSFKADGAADEARLLRTFLEPMKGRFLAHLDLHETTDSDESEFRPALAARDGKPFEPGVIPDGFYLVDDTKNPQPGFHAAIIEAVAQVTHIAEPDEKGHLIGEPLQGRGVVHYDTHALGLCASVSGARFTTTTEVYPDSPRASPEQCNEAQATAARAGLEYALSVA